MTALDVGKRTHVKLENETKNIMKELTKVDVDEGTSTARGSGSNQDHERGDESSEDEDSDSSR